MKKFERQNVRKLANFFKVAPLITVKTLIFTRPDTKILKTRRRKRIIHQFIPYHVKYSANPRTKAKEYNINPLP